MLFEQGRDISEPDVLAEVADRGAFVGLPYYLVDESLAFEERGPAIEGPVASMSKAVARTTSVAKPLTLSLWASDDAKYTSNTNAPVRNLPPPVHDCHTPQSHDPIESYGKVFPIERNPYGYQHVPAYFPHFCRLFAGCVG